MGGRHYVEPHVAQLALQAACAHDEDPLNRGLVLAQVQSRGPGRTDDTVRRDGRAHALEPCHVRRAVEHRVVRHVDDVVAAGDPIGEHGRDARHGIGSAVDDAVKIDQQEHH